MDSIEIPLTDEQDSELQNQELTDEQITRLDFVHNAIFNLMQDLVPDGKELEWDISIISEVADDICDYLVKKGICTEMGFAPFVERE